jgi:hypothetical protein
MPPNPPNLLPSAKTHDFKVPQVLYTQIRNGCGAEDSPVDGLEKKTNILNGVVLVQRSPPPVAVVRSPRQQEQPTQEAYAQSKVSEWVSLVAIGIIPAKYLRLLCVVFPESRQVWPGTFPSNSAVAQVGSNFAPALSAAFAHGKHDAETYLAAI